MGLIHFGFGDTGITGIRVFLNGYSGDPQEYDYSYPRTSYPYGFDFENYTSSTDFLAIYNGGTSSSVKWFEYNLTTDSRISPETAAYIGGFNASRAYVVTVHSPGVTGSMTVVNALDEDWKPYKVRVGSTDYITATTVQYKGGKTFNNASYDTSTVFTNILRHDSLQEDEGGWFRKYRLDANSPEDKGSSTSGYQNTGREYLLIQHGQAAPTPTTYTISATTGAGASSVSPTSTTATSTTGATFTATLEEGYWNTWTEVTVSSRKYYRRNWFEYDTCSWSITTGSGTWGDVTGQPMKKVFYPTSNSQIKVSGIATATSNYEYKFVIPYNANGGTGTMTASESSVATSPPISAYITVKSCTFTAPDGYHFKEWNTKSDGTGTTYGTGSQVFTTDVTLYAIWQIDYFNWTNTIAVGEPITNLTAADWIRLQDKVEQIRGSAYSSWLPVASNTGLSADIFNEMRDRIYALNNSVNICSRVTKGVTEIKAVYFEGQTTSGVKSLKNAINWIIDQL